MESPPVLRPERTLSTAERIELIQTLNGLPLSQILQLEFALDVPKGIVPPPHEMQGIRTRALLNWVDGSTGIGWDKFLDVLREVTGISLTCQSQRLKVVIEGDISGVDSELLLKMLAEFQAKADAPSLKISSIKSGSIELTLQGTPEDLECLRELIKSGQLAYIEGQRIRTATAFFDLSGANLSEANLGGSHLSQTHLSEANFRGADLSMAELMGSDLSRANLEGANLMAANLIGANCRGADFSKANLSWASCAMANLSEANLMGASLTQVSFRGANLIGANLRGSDLSMANLEGANLEGANLSEVNLSEARFGNNLGLNQTDKIDFIERGAIFQDNPDSDVPVLV